MQEQPSANARKAATAARMYDYYLGGIHNFPADREAADAVIAQFPFIRDAARANRGFVARAVQFLAASGIDQYLDVGAGIPTVDNVHTIVRATRPGARVVYVDLDPVAVAEGLDILTGDERATAVRGDLLQPKAILEHPEVRRILDFGRPVGLVLAAVLHFVPDDAQAQDVTAELMAALPAGSHLVISHTATESFASIARNPATEDVYQRRTATPGTIRTRDEVARLFGAVEVLPPGVVWAQQWTPGAAADASPPAGPGGIWAGVGRKS